MPADTLAPHYCYLCFFMVINLDLVNPLAGFPCLASISLFLVLSHQLGQSTKTAWVKLLKQSLHWAVSYWMSSDDYSRWSDSQAGLAECKAPFDTISFVCDWIVGIVINWTMSKMLCWKGHTWMSAVLNTRDALPPIYWLGVCVYVGGVFEGKYIFGLSLNKLQWF